MKIRQRLALRFTLVTALLIGAILLFVYLLTRGFAHADFSQRLSQQARIEVIHFTTPRLRSVLPQGGAYLVNPEASIFDVRGDLLYSHGDYPISTQWVEFLKTNEEFNTERGEYTCVGRKFEINGQTYLVFVSGKDFAGDNELNILQRAMALGFVVSVMLAYLAGLYFSRGTLSTVNRVVREVNQITKDNLSYRLKMNKTPEHVDEMDELVITFNALLTRIENAFISQKRFVQNASHELRTPLTAIIAEAELALAKDRTIEEYNRTLRVVLREAERLVLTTQGLLTLTRMEEAPFQYEMDKVVLRAFGQETLETFKLHHPDREVEVVRSYDAVHVRAHAELLRMAILNMLDNAVKYSTEKIMIYVTQRDSYVSITVHDEGIGIPQDELHRIRSPLFRGSNVSDVPGAGLGLSLVDRIMKVHRGSLHITSELGKGTDVEIRIPVEG